ncbi:MAG TPA: LPD25 domain-containing protein [Pseudogracilibacillus sp.]|nr:LPD25 domain-containing protein [Pseudogracilibacillus sp.]
MMEFVEGNETLGDLEEKYQNKQRYYKTKYHIFFPESEDFHSEIVTMDEFDIGSTEYINPYQQILIEGDLIENQQMKLDNIYKEALLCDDKSEINDRLQYQTGNKKQRIMDFEFG